MKPPSDRWAALAPLSVLFLLGIFLFANQYLTLPRLKAFVLSQTVSDSMTSLQHRALALVLGGWRDLLSPLDILILVGILGCIAYLVVAEVRQRRLTALLRGVESSSLLCFGLLGLIALLATRYYLNPGQVFMGDTETHTLRSFMVSQLIRAGETPVWSNAWYGGLPLLEYYAPLYYVLTAAFTLLFGDIHLATKLLLWLCHVGSVFVMFLLLRETSGRPLAAFLGAVAYAFSFLRVHMILYQGDVHLSVVFLLCPLILLILEGFIRTPERARRTFVILTLAIAALILNHHGYAFFGLVFTGIYLVVRLATDRERDWHDRIRVLGFFTLSGVSAALVSAFLLVPFVLEADQVRGMPAMPFAVLVPNPRGPLLLLRLFRWACIGDGSNVGYIGLSIGVLGLIAIPYVVRGRIAPGLGFLAAGVASLLMVKNNVHYNVKNVDFLMIYACGLAAWAPHALLMRADRGGLLGRLRARFGEGFEARLVLVLLGLVVLDLGPSTFQSLYREDYVFKERMYARVRALGASYKVIERQVLKFEPGGPPDQGFNPHKVGVPSAFSWLQTPLGFFHEGAPRCFGYNAEMVKNLFRDLNRGRVSDRSVRGLYLMGVRYVLFRDRYAAFSPELEPSPAFELEDGILRLRQARPLVVSTRAMSASQVPGFEPHNVIESRQYFDGETFDYDERLSRELVFPLIDAMRLDLETGIAETLLVKGRSLPPLADRSEDILVEIQDFEVTLKTVEVRYRSNVELYGRLAYSYFPYLEVAIDGRPVPFHRSAMGYVLLRLPAGEHVLTRRGVASPTRRATLAFSAAALLLILFVPAAVVRRFEVPATREPGEAGDAGHSPGVPPSAESRRKA